MIGDWPHMRWIDVDAVLVIDHIREPGEELAAEERMCSSNMSPIRLREYAAGRRVAKRALELLEMPSGIAVPMGAGGEPLWPLGISGSLSHTSSHAAALVARSSRHASVGIDLDDHRLLGEDAASELMTPDEIATVLQQGWTTEPAMAHNLAFLAKEALFKYQYPLTGRRDLDFAEVHLHPSKHVGVLAASNTDEDAQLQRVLTGVLVYYEEIQGLRVCWALSSY